MDLVKNKYMVEKRISLGGRNRRRKKKYNKLSLQNGRLDLVSSSITNCRLTRPIGIYSRAKTSDHVLRAAEEDSGVLATRFPVEELPLPKTHLVDSEKSKNRFRDRKLNFYISRECQTIESGTVTGDFHTLVKCDQTTPQPKLRLSRQPVSGITQTTSSSSSTSKSNATDDIPLDDIIRRLQDSLEIQNEALFPNKNWEAKLKRELQETYYYVRRNLLKSTSEYSQQSNSERRTQNEESAAVCSHTVSSAVTNRCYSKHLKTSSHDSQVDKGDYSNQPFKLFFTDAHASSQEDAVYRPVFMDRGDGSRFPTVDLGFSYCTKTSSCSFPDEGISHQVSKIEHKFNPDILDSLDSYMPASAESGRTKSTCIISEKSRSRRRHLRHLTTMSSDSDGSPIWQLVRSPSPLRPPPASEESWKFSRRRMY